jgi:hypothetical protein
VALLVNHTQGQRAQYSYILLEQYFSLAQQQSKKMSIIKKTYIPKLKVSIVSRQHCVHLRPYNIPKLRALLLSPSFVRFRHVPSTAPCRVMHTSMDRGPPPRPSPRVPPLSSACTHAV